MNVILTVPGSPGAPGVHLEDKFAFPVESLGLGYLAAMLQAHDIEVEIVDGYADRLTWLEDVRGNIDFLLNDLQHRGNPAKHLRRLIPIHGTPMWHRLKADGLLTGEFPEWEFRFKDSRVETRIAR